MTKQTYSVRSKERLAIRNLTKEEFIDKHASGTLRKASKSGLNCDSHYLHERLAFEFGFSFESIDINKNTVIVKEGISLPDTPAITEALWLYDRYMAVRPFDDEFYLRYIKINEEKEGLAIILEDLAFERINWIPEDHMVFAIIAEYDPVNKTWKDAVNPC